MNYWRIDRSVEACYTTSGREVIRADNDAIRLKKIVDGTAFAQEFGVRDDEEIVAPPCGGEYLGGCYRNPPIN